MVRVNGNGTEENKPILFKNLEMVQVFNIKLSAEEVIIVSSFKMNSEMKKNKILKCKHLYLFKNQMYKSVQK